MGKIIAIANQKGGVGKTTTTINLAASLGVCKRWVLLIDMDPQGNATTGSGVAKNGLTLSMNEVLLNDTPLTEVIIKSSMGYDILPANGGLTFAETKLLQIEEREFCLRRVLAKVRDFYDYIFIDCPPSLNMLTVNALVAADSVLIPMQCEYYALEGLTSLVGTIEQLQNSANPNLEIEGLLRTMYDGRSRLALQVSEQLLQYFPDKVYKTFIPRNVRLAEAPSYGLPAILYDKHSAGAVAYMALAREMNRKAKKRS